jgi:1-aminocyclopropane-1-carboxylate deaminase
LRLNLLNIPINLLESPLTESRGIQLSVLRLDAIHPVVSGNKLFKLTQYLDAVRKQDNRRIITFGGAYSNHLVATAYACSVENISCIGMVRGEKPEQLSHTLQSCMQYGMELQFLSRELYQLKQSPEYLTQLKSQYPGATIIPEGGFGIDGAEGAAEIMEMIPKNTTHICCAIGTGTTFAGLLLKAKKHQQLIGIPVLKGMTDLEDRVRYLTSDRLNLHQVTFFTEYHFGGYAKKTPELIAFMNNTWSAFSLPTDFVYTAKMMYGVFDLTEQHFFPPGSNVLCVHTGGLQGNISLPKNTLTF